MTERLPRTEPNDFTEGIRQAAAEWDTAGGPPRDMAERMAKAGLLGADLPADYGGSARSALQLGELTAALGAVCTSLRSLLTVQTMVAAAVLRWGTEEQRHTWLPALASGERIAGLAVTEADAGSDLNAVETTIERDGGRLRVNGRKLWVTYGEWADVLLVLGRDGDRPTAVLVETDRPGVEREPVSGQLGLRGARIAHIRLRDVEVPAENRVAPPGFGLSHVIGTALDHGRFTVAWGCVGMTDACLEEAAGHVLTRRQNGVALAEHELVRAKIAEMHLAAASARALAERAARLRDDRAPDAASAAFAAKYAAARAAASVSRDAVQLQGAAGCAPDSLAQRFFRDAKVMQIIEGADEVALLRIAEHVLGGRRARTAPSRNPAGNEAAR
ncbi:acyl-CoA/acyl-ACP dehydrogenase [Streptomyces achromogenes]|uniref:Acyl-CoA/acyl-ACP dehydrogenase n=1 Tax=Streptomyces achromogenes TaxID=67255 RepID=A0ABZ1KIU2_STRAH